MTAKQPAAPYALLLLPPVPQPATYLSIKAAYHSPLLLCIRHLLDGIGSNSGLSTGGGSGSGSCASSRITLDIAVSCPHLYTDSTCRASLYATTQQIVANVYKLICVIAARQGVEVADVDGDGLVDARIILLAYPRDSSARQQSIGSGSSSNPSDAWLGPVVGLKMLATSQRQWQTVVSVQTDQGQGLLENFRALRDGAADKARYVQVKGGVIQVDDTAAAAKDADLSSMCNSVAVGGTFDHLHIGHKLLLTMVAFALDPPGPGKPDPEEKAITIGMTAADLLAKKKYAEVLQSWSTRTDRTHAFMCGIMCFGTTDGFTERTEEVHNPGPNGHAVLIHLSTPRGKVVLRYTEIWDPFGPTITDPHIDTLIVSGETRGGGQAVNDKRVEMQMAPLRVREVDVLDAEEEHQSQHDGRAAGGKAVEDAFQAKLSSTEIRRVQAERLKRKSRV